MAVADQVLTGTKTIVAGDGTTVAVSFGADTVDEDRSVILFTARDGDSDIRILRHWFRPVFTGGTAAARTGFDLIRDTSTSATTVVLTWYVVEFASGDATVQHGVVTPSADPTNVTLGTAVDVTQAVPICAYEFSTLDLATDQAPRALFADLTGDSAATLRFDFNSAPTSGDLVIGWQVVEFAAADITVQSGSVNLDATEQSDTATITAVDLSKTALAYHFQTTSTFNWMARSMIEAHFTSTTQIQFQRDDAGTSPVLDVQWYAIEFLDGTTVRAGTTTIPDLATVPTTQPSLSPSIDTARAAVWSGSAFVNSHQTANTTPTNNRVEKAIFSTTQLDLTRTGTAGALTVSWFVIEWASGAAGPSLPPQLALLGVG